MVRIKVTEEDLSVAAQEIASEDDMERSVSSHQQALTCMIETLVQDILEDPCAYVLGRGSLAGRYDKAFVQRPLKIAA
jgi:hypothetical protein